MKKYLFYKYPEFAIAVLIIGFYVFLDLILAYVFISEDYNSFRTKHFYYHHGLLPNQSSIASWNSIRYPMFTNSAGCRDKDASIINPEPSGKRILFIGDSHTEGVGLPYFETFAGIIQKRLEKSGTELLNASAVSYSPKIYFLRTKFLLDVQNIKVSEAFVFIDISDARGTVRIKYCCSLHKILQFNPFPYFFNLFRCE